MNAAEEFKGVVRGDEVEVILAHAPEADQRRHAHQHQVMADGGLRLTDGRAQRRHAQRPVFRQQEQ